MASKRRRDAGRDGVDVHLAAAATAAKVIMTPTTVPSKPEERPAGDADGEQHDELVDRLLLAHESAIERGADRLDRAAGERVGCYAPRPGDGGFPPRRCGRCDRPKIAEARAALSRSTRPPRRLDFLGVSVVERGEVGGQMPPLFMKRLPFATQLR